MILADNALRRQTGARNQARADIDGQDERDNPPLSAWNMDVKRSNADEKGSMFWRMPQGTIVRTSHKIARSSQN